MRTAEKSLSGRCVVITGGARGQGRSHAVTLAEQGADIVLCDILDDLEAAPYGLATQSDMDETVALLEAAGASVAWQRADVRVAQDMRSVAELAMSRFGRIDILVANAGIHDLGPATHEISESRWRAMIDVNLTGAWTAACSVVPHMISGGRPGVIVFSSSVDGLRPSPGWGHYGVAKHGLQGLMKTMAYELAEHRIRVNTINPTGVDTPMVQGVAAGFTEVAARWPQLDRTNLMSDVEQLAPADVSKALLWLVSDDARYVTGQALAVDAGILLK